MEGMFLINTTPVGVHKALSDYAKILTRRFVVTQFNHGCQEVHVIFDNPGSLPNTPKYFEHIRRDQTAEVSTYHYCDDLNCSSKIPKGKWRRTSELLLLQKEISVVSRQTLSQTSKLFFIHNKLCM